MLTSRRDYLLRLFDETIQLLARVIFQRSKGRLQDALQSVVQACERLFDMEGEQLFQFTPEQQYAMLTENEPAEAARDKALLYAALNAEAGRIYTEMGNLPMARGSFLNALRFTLKAQLSFGADNPPDYAPRIPELLNALKDAPLDADTAELLRAAPTTSR